MTMRFRLPPGGDVPPVTAARRLALTLEAFEHSLQTLLARGFPPADATTGNFDLDAIDAWRRSRHPQLFPSDRLLVGPAATDADTDFAARLARFKVDRRPKRVKKEAGA